MSGNINKTGIGTNESDGMGSLREPLLEVEPVPMPVPVLTSSDIEVGPGVVPLVPSSIVPPCDGDGASIVDAMHIDVDINESEWDHGEIQPKAYRDCFWGLLFLAQFAAVAVVGVMGIRNFIKSSSIFPSDDDDSISFDRKHAVIFLAVLPCTVVLLPSVIINLLLVAFSSMLIQISLLIAPTSYFISFVGSILTMNCPVGFFCLVMFLISTYYAIQVWYKIPFCHSKSPGRTGIDPGQPWSLDTCICIHF